MPRPEFARAGAVVATLAIALAGCSRLNIMKPSYGRGRYEQVAREVHIDPKAHLHDEAFSMTQIAQLRLVEGDAKAAADAGERAVKADPEFADAHSILALAQDRLGRAGEAGAHFRRAAELAPDRGALLNNYGIWLCANGQQAASLDWFERAARAQGYETPDLALANAASCARRAGQTALAERDARQALALAPSNPLALLTLAHLQFDAGHGLEARAFIERRLAAGRADAETLQLASQIEQSLGDTAAAARYVQRLRTEFPPDSRPSGDQR